MMTEEEREKLGDVVLEAATEVHQLLGPGLLESVYQTCLCKELELKGIFFQKHVLLPIQYKKFQLDAEYTIDIMVDNEIIVELKAIDELQQVHEAQLLTYLKLAHKKLGLLINFNVPKLKNGIKKINVESE